MHKKLFRKIALFAVFCVLVGSFSLSKTAFAGSGSIPEFSINASNLSVHIRVSCPGNVEFTWRVGVDSTSNIVYEEGSQGKDFTIDRSRVSNGHHNVVGQVRCNGEPNDWSNATTSTVGFDWSGNPAPTNPPLASPTPLPFPTNPPNPTNKPPTPIPPNPPTVTPIGTSRPLPTNPPQGTATPPYANAQLPDSGIHLGIYCVDLFGPGAREEHSSDDAYSFRCLGPQQGQFQYVNFPAACREVYGNWKPYATLGNSRDLGGWKCSETQGYIDPPHIGGVNPTATPRTSNPTNTPQPGGGGECPGKLERRLHAGMKAKIIREDALKLRLRFESGDFSKSYNPGTVFTVLSDGQCGTYNWWFQVRIDSDGNQGWFPEGRSDDGYWLEPVQATAPTATRAIAPTATPVQQGRFEYVARAPYKECEGTTSSYKNATILQLANEGTAIGHGNCNIATGYLNLLAVSYGGTNENQQRTANVNAYMLASVTPNFTGKMKVAVILTINGKYGTAAGPSGIILPEVDLQDWIIAQSEHPDLIEQGNKLPDLPKSAEVVRDLTNLAASYQKASGAQIQITAELKVMGNTISQELVNQVSVFPPILPGSGMLNQNAFEQQTVILTTIVDVQSGINLNVAAGLNVTTKAKGFASSVWNSWRRSSSVTSIVFTQIP